MRHYTLLFLIFLALGAVGCLPSGPVSQSDGVHGAENYTVRIWANTDCPSTDQTITLRARVTNDGPQTEVAQADGEPVLDILVSPSGAAEDDKSAAIRWSDGKSLTPDLTRLELKPGESKSIELQFPFRAEGYSASARFVYDAAHPKDAIQPSLYLRQFCGGY